MCPADDPRRAQAAFATFAEAAEALLHMLAAMAPMQAWLVTRVDGEDWIPLVLSDRGYGLARGEALPWHDSFCVRMVRGEGPAVAGTCGEVGAYREAPIGQRLPIGAYAGYPIHAADGSLFGTLCAIDPEPREIDAAALERAMALASRLLSTFLVLDHARRHAERHARDARTEAETDALTGVLNRRGLDRAIERLQAEIEADVSAAGVVFVDLDRLKQTNDQLGHAAGDALIQRCAEVLTDALRGEDVMARVGGDEFAVLLPDALRDGTRRTAERIGRALERGGVEATLGWDWSGVGGSLHEAFARADHAMLERKRRRRDTPADSTG